MPWRSWKHGRIWIGKSGRPTYYIIVDGKMVSTRCHTEDEALAELFKNGLATGTPELHPLSDKNIEEYCAACEAIGQTGVNKKRRHLRNWRDHVAWRRVTLPLLNQIVPKLTGARNQVATLKAFYTWLRQQGRAVVKKRWSRGCPACGGKSFADPDHVDGLAPPTWVGTDVKLWVFPLTCTDCGHVSLLNSGFLDVVAGRKPGGED